MSRDRPPLQLLVYGFQAAAQFQLVAGGAGLSPEHLDDSRALAAAATRDAAKYGFATGRADRIGAWEGFALAVPTSVREALSDRAGLAVTLLILGRRRRRLNAAWLVQALASLEMALSAALSESWVGYSGSIDLLAARLQDESAMQVAERLTLHAAAAENHLNAAAAAGTRPFRRTVPIGETFNVHSNDVLSGLLATMVAGLRSSGQAQQCLLLRVGTPNTSLPALSAHRFCNDLLIFSYPKDVSS